MSTYGSAEGEESAGDLGDVFLLPEVDCLEYVEIRNSVIFDRLLEIVDVLHHFELSTGRVYLGDASRLEFVDEFAEDLSILENFLVGNTWREFLTENLFDPRLGFLILFRISLGVDLSKGQVENRLKHKNKKSDMT